jgi:hypothetical protein
LRGTIKTEHCLSVASMVEATGFVDVWEIAEQPFWHSSCDVFWMQQVRTRFSFFITSMSRMRVGTARQLDLSRTANKRKAAIRCRKWMSRTQVSLVHATQCLFGLSSMHVGSASLATPRLVIAGYKHAILKDREGLNPPSPEYLVMISSHSRGCHPCSTRCLQTNEAADRLKCGFPRGFDAPRD